MGGGEGQEAIWWWKKLGMDGGNFLAPNERREGAGIREDKQNREGTYLGH